MSGTLELMRLLQLGDSMLPIGAFTFSNGLESAVQLGHVHDADTLRQFVATACAQAASCDGIALLYAHRAARADDLERVGVADRAVFNRKLNGEMRTMTTRMGRKMAELLRHVQPSPLLDAWLAQIGAQATPGCHPIALALAFAALELPEREAFAAHQYGVATMMLGAALRLMKLNHLDAQAILFTVNESVGGEYERRAAQRLDDMATFAPLLDIVAAAHSQAHVRLFMS